MDASDIICESITCTCEREVVVKCLPKIHYVCAKLTCGFNIDADHEYFKEYVQIMKECQQVLELVVGKKWTCPCGVLLKTNVERVNACYGDCTLDNELQLFFICRNGVCNYKRSLVELKQSRIRCVCDRYCQRDGEIYKCVRGELGCGTYFHKLDSLTYMHTEMLKYNLEDNAFVYLSTNASKLECGHYGILKYSNKYNEVLYVCKHLFCDYFTEAVKIPRIK
jgi:hypothetical protein